MSFFNFLKQQLLSPKSCIGYSRNRYIIFCIFIGLCLSLAGLVSLNSTVLTSKLLQSRHATSIDMIDERLTSLVGEINNFPRTAGNDIVFLSQLSTVKLANPINLEQDFLTFLLENTAYHYLGFIGKQSEILVLAEYDGKNYAASQKLQTNPFKPQWLEKANRLTAGEVFISPIDLAEKDHAPIIVYATPVYDNNLVKQGIIVASVYANYFLDDIRDSQREGEVVFLIDNEGNYLAHPDTSKEYGHILGHAYNFASDYPEVSDQILANPEKRMIETSFQVFTTRTIYPTKGSFALHKGAEKLNNLESDSYWMLVSVTDKKYLEKNARELIVSSGIFTVLVFAMIAGIAGTGYLLKKGKRK